MNGCIGVSNSGWERSALLPSLSTRKNGYKICIPVINVSNSLKIVRARYI